MDFKKNILHFNVYKYLDNINNNNDNNIKYIYIYI